MWGRYHCMNWFINSNQHWHQLIYQLVMILSYYDLLAYHDIQLIMIYQIVIIYHLSWLSAIMIYQHIITFQLIMTYRLWWILSRVSCTRGGGGWCVGSRLHSQPFPPSISLHCTLSIHHYSTVLKLQVFFRLKYNCCVEKKKNHTSCLSWALYYDV